MNRSRQAARARVGRSLFHLVGAAVAMKKPAAEDESAAGEIVKRSG
jgi:hypothetical protein